MSEVYPPGEHVPFCMGPDGGGACTGYLALYTDWLRRIDRIEKLEAGRMGMSPLEQTVATNIKRLKDRIEALEAALRETLERSTITNQIIRAALAPEQDK
jgi:hypothetical protein